MYNYAKGDIVRMMVPESFEGDPTATFVDTQAVADYPGHPSVVLSPDDGGHCVVVMASTVSQKPGELKAGKFVPLGRHSRFPNVPALHLQMQPIADPCRSWQPLEKMRKDNTLMICAYVYGVPTRMLELWQHNRDNGPNRVRLEKPSLESLERLVEQNSLQHTSVGKLVQLITVARLRASCQERSIKDYIRFRVKDWQERIQDAKLTEVQRRFRGRGSPKPDLSGWKLISHLLDANTQLGGFGNHLKTLDEGRVYAREHGLSGRDAQIAAMFYSLWTARKSEAKHLELFDDRRRCIDAAKVFVAGFRLSEAISKSQVLELVQKAKNLTGDKRFKYVWKAILPEVSYLNPQAPLFTPQKVPANFTQSESAMNPTSMAPGRLVRQQAAVTSNSDGPILSPKFQLRFAAPQSPSHPGSTDIYRPSSRAESPRSHTSSRKRSRSEMEYADGLDSESREDGAEAEEDDGPRHPPRSRPRRE